MNFKKIGTVSIGICAMLMTACGASKLNYAQVVKYLDEHYTHGDEETVVADEVYSWNFEATTGDAYKEIMLDYAETWYGTRALKGEKTYTDQEEYYFPKQEFKEYVKSDEDLQKNGIEFFNEGGKLVMHSPMEIEVVEIKWTINTITKYDEIGRTVLETYNFKDLHDDKIGEGKASGTTIITYNYKA